MNAQRPNGSAGASPSQDTEYQSLIRGTSTKERVRNNFPIWPGSFNREPEASAPVPAAIPNRPGEFSRETPFDALASGSRLNGELVSDTVLRYA